ISLHILFLHIHLFNIYVAHHDLHSFPTRRSSDLHTAIWRQWMSIKTARRNLIQQFKKPFLKIPSAQILSKIKMVTSNIAVSRFSQYEIIVKLIQSSRRWARKYVHSNVWAFPSRTIINL